VQELLSDVSKWTQGAVARDASGNSCWEDDEEAVCWCFMGAIRYCYPNKDAVEIIMRRLRDMGITSPGLWNDRVTWEQVRELATTLDI